MRIVHIITRMIVGGAQENTRFNCLDLSRIYGDEVTLITGPSLGAEGSLLEKFSDPDLNIALVPELIRSIRPWTDFVAYRKLRNLLKELRPDVVHTHSAKAGVLGRAAAWSLRIPCVVHTVHGAPFHPFQPWIARTTFQQCERWAAKRCHKLISVANAMTDLMVDANVAPRKKFVTIYSGMDVEPFLQADQMRAQARQELGLQPSDIVVGKIARLFNLKGHEYLLQAAPAIVAANPNIKFLLVGDGSLRSAIEKTIATHGLESHFLFTGLVPPTEIPKWISAMDLLAHVSLREGLARALPQAMLAGKPVVSYDIDGAKEVVLHEKTGFLLPPKSIHELQTAILTLANDPSLRTRFGLEGQQRCKEIFPHEIMTQQIRSLYGAILAQA
jgi:glycosyltransferase involved in cell wall biosynthesis